MIQALEVWSEGYPRALSGIRAGTSKRLVIRYLLLCVELVTHPDTSKTLEG
jgi:hypothetical protein